MLCLFLETVTEIAAEDSRSGISPPVLGCIVLSIALLLLLLSNAAQCAYYKIQNGKYTKLPLFNVLVHVSSVL